MTTEPWRDALLRVRRICNWTRRSASLHSIPKLNRLIILFASALALCSSHISASPERMQFYYHIAEGNYLIGDYSGAERGIEQMLRLDEAYAPALALRARILLDQEKPEEALSAAQAATNSAPEKLEYQLLEALILGNLDRRDEALVRIEQVLKRAEPESEDALVATQLKGLMNMAEGNWDEAAEAFQSTYNGQAEGNSSGRQLASEAYLEKAQSQLAGGKLTAAIKAIDEAIALYNEVDGAEALAARNELRLMRAQTLARIGRTEEAISELRQLIAQSPNNLEAITTLASLYAATDRWESLSELIEPIAAQPELSHIALYLEGRVALARDRVGTARKKLEEAIEIQKQRPTGLMPALLFYTSICLERLERFDEAEDTLIESIESGFEPESVAEALHLGSLLMRIKKTDTLIPLLEKALIRGASDSAEAWALLGRAQRAESQNALAISALNKSLEIDPTQSKTLALRGSLLREVGDLEGARADYERAQKLQPSSPVLSYELGLVFLQLGKLDDSESALRVAARKLSNHVTLDLLHASCAYALGKYDEAAQSLSEYLEPELFGDALEHFKANQSDTAAYLHTLLTLQDFSIPELSSQSHATELFNAYVAGQTARKEVLDWAGRAESPAAARSQICAAAFWMAQSEHLKGEIDASKQLLDIALEMGGPENPEWQFANWQRAKE